MSGGVSTVTRQCERRHYYGYGSVIDKRRFRSREPVEFWNAKGKDALVVRVFEELLTVIKSCVRELVEVIRVLEF
jgi:hypothetical protein